MAIAGAGQVLRKHFNKRQLGRRIAALVAAYVIALSGVIANFAAAAVTAADVAGVPAAFICHYSADGQHSPAGGQHSGDSCNDDCCTGCLILAAALPPPPADPIAVANSSDAIIEPHAAAVFTAAPITLSHRSRAPPQTA